MEDVILIKPTLEYEGQAIEMMKETEKNDEGSLDMWAGYASMQKYDNYADWLKKLEADLDMENIKPGRVPASVYFLLRKEDNKVLGIIHIRHELNEKLK